MKRICKCFESKVKLQEMYGLLCFWLEITICDNVLTYQTKMENGCKWRPVWKEVPTVWTMILGDDQIHRLSWTRPNWKMDGISGHI